MEALAVATRRYQPLMLPLSDDNEFFSAGDGTEAMRDAKGGTFSKRLDLVGPMAGPLSLAVDTRSSTLRMSSVLRR